MNPISFLPQTAHFLQGTCTFSTISDLLIPMGLPNFNIRSGTIFLLVSLGINWPQLTVTTYYHLNLMGAIASNAPTTVVQERYGPRANSTT